MESWVNQQKHQQIQEIITYIIENSKEMDGVLEDNPVEWMQVEEQTNSGMVRKRM
jgi:hypothetical protein